MSGSGTQKQVFCLLLPLTVCFATDYYNNQLRLGNNEYWFGNSNINLSLRVPITEVLTGQKE